MGVKDILNDVPAHRTCQLTYSHMRIDVFFKTFSYAHLFQCYPPQKIRHLTCSVKGNMRLYADACRLHPLYDDGYPVAPAANRFSS